MTIACPGGWTATHHEASTEAIMELCVGTISVPARYRCEGESTCTHLTGTLGTGSTPTTVRMDEAESVRLPALASSKPVCRSVPSSKGLAEHRAETCHTAESEPRSMRWRMPDTIHPSMRINSAVRRASAPVSHTHTTWPESAI